MYRNLLEAINALQGRNFAATLPTSGQALAWNDTSKRWEPATVGGVAIGELYSQMERTPASPNAKNEEMGGAISGSWTWNATNGTPSSSAMTTWLDTAAGTDAPLYNINTDIPSALVMRAGTHSPGGGQLVNVYRTFTSTSGTRWAVMAKIQTAWQASGDEFGFFIVKETPGTTVSTPALVDAVWVRFRDQGGSRITATRYASSVPTNLTDFNQPGFPIGAIYVAFTQNTDDKLEAWLSRDGVAWYPTSGGITSTSINGQVVNVGFRLYNNGISAFCLGIVEWVRFLEGNNNLWLMGMGN